MLTTILALKAVTEIAGLSLFARWVLGRLAGAQKEQNLIYQILHIVCQPMLKLARWATPRVVLEQHLPLVAFLLLGFAWVLLVWAKIEICLQVGVNACL
ncbi:hypothetical protein [Hydrogenophaga sp.]|uniref:hypothetical protein n=1 Tax=Hydrogenophaga sp. TaxID=1904254 RepID=UPI0035667427